MNEIEDLWDNLLSQAPERILAAFQSLDPEEQDFIRKHLVRMVTEDGWQPTQQESARTALEALGQIPTDRTTGK